MTWIKSVSWQYILVMFVAQVSDNATNLVLDDGLAKKLWEASEAYVRLQPEEVHY